MARTKKVVAEVINEVTEELKKEVTEEVKYRDFKKGVDEMEKEAQELVKEVTEEVKYIKCEIVRADVDVTTKIVTLTVEDVNYQADLGFWFQEDFKPTYYTVELDMNNDSDRQLLFDRLIKYCFACAKHHTIIDKIQKGLVGYNWRFSEKKLQKVA